MRSRAAAGSGGLVWLLAALYLAQGLPFGFFTQALPVLMRESGYSLTAISAIGLLFAPWGLKFLWAPYVDALGSRRMWLLSMQFGSAAVAFALALSDLDSNPALLFIGVAVINVLSATQDIATDGLTVTRLGPRQRGLGNALQVGAYRVGMVIGGGVLLWLFSRAGSHGTFTAMGVLLLVTTLPVAIALRSGKRSSAAGGEPARSPSPEPTTRSLSTQWWRRLTQQGFIGFGCLLIAFKFGDVMASAIIGPYLVDCGFSTDEIAVLKGMIASATVLLGAAVGGLLAWRLSRRHALIIGAALQCLALLLLALSAFDVGGPTIILAAVISESVFGGVATVALYALMMDASDPANAGADYTVLACAVVGAQGAGALAGGLVGDLLGYQWLFSIAVVFGIAGSAAIVFGLDRGVGPDRIRDTWPVLDRRRTRVLQ